MSFLKALDFFKRKVDLNGFWLSPIRLGISFGQGLHARVSQPGYSVLGNNARVSSLGLMGQVHKARTMSANATRPPKNGLKTKKSNIQDFQEKNQNFQNPDWHF